MLVHRRDLHKHQRKVEFNIDELIQVLCFFFPKYWVQVLNMSWRTTSVYTVEHLQQILDHNKNTKEYFYSFRITILDDNHPFVMQYFKDKRTSSFALSAKSNIDEASVAYILETICFETKSIAFS